MKKSGSNRISLKVDRLIKFYEDKPLLNELSFTVGAEEIICLLGPSGSGKSTLLRIIGGLEPFEGGYISWQGNDLDNVPTEQRAFGLMFQDYALFPHLNVFENVAFGLRMQNLPADAITLKVNHALERVSMLGFSRRKVQKLSGGEQQRIALARTLAPEPKLIMLDEPLGALDRKLREQLTQEIRQILRAAGVPAIYVTHDQEEAFTLADRILILFNGRIIQSGTPEELFKFPSSSWVAHFLGLGNILDGAVISVQPIIVRTILGDIHCPPQATGLRAEGSVNILVRPDGVEITKKGKGTFQGIVEDCVFQGDHYRTVIRVQNSSFIFNLFEKSLPGNTVTLKIKEEKGYLLDTPKDR
jgi:spermidine/putrescine transport system ATP-binding protein